MAKKHYIPKMASSLLLLRPPLPLPRSSPFIIRNPHQIPSNFNPRKHFLNFKPFLSVATNALTESSDSPKSLDPPDPQSLLQELAVFFKHSYILFHTITLIESLIFMWVLLIGFELRVSDEHYVGFCRIVSIFRLITYRSSLAIFV